MDNASNSCIVPSASFNGSLTTSASDVDAGQVMQVETLLTKDMLEEEERLHKESVEDERKITEKAIEEIEKMEEEMRYRRLNHLLEKSTVFTQFLVKKMETQQEDEKKKQERMENKRSKSSSKQTEEMNICQSKNGHNSGKKGGKKAASKRKREESFRISDYFDKDELKAKRRRKEGDDVNGPNGDGTQQPEGCDIADTFSRIIDGQRVSDYQPELFSGGVLRPYQLKGMQWLKLLYENGVNGILADEMGLGKTVQCIALFASVICQGSPGPFLVCAPLSTLPNWISEFKRFTPQIPVVLYHGTASERSQLRRQIGERQPCLPPRQVYPSVVTSYEIIMKDRKHMQHFPWKYIVVDEGHRIKNLNCKLICELKQYRSSNRLLLTGTPLQNNLAELWSMLNFLMPEVFDDLTTFEAWFSANGIAKAGDEAIVAKEKEDNILTMMHQILTPFLLRRLKSDVEIKIPPKKEILVFAPLTEKQLTFYKATVDKTILTMFSKKDKDRVELKENGRPSRKCSKVKNYDEDKMLLDQANHVNNNNNNDNDDGTAVENGLGKADRNCNTVVNDDGDTVTSLYSVKAHNPMMQLRKCCNHPYLIEHPLDPRTQDFLVDEGIVKTSGKMLVLDRILPSLQKKGHKVLLFSQMTSMMDIIGNYCDLRHYDYCRLDGTMSFSTRQQQIDDFNRDPAKFLFLLSTRAGGLGINLAAADTVIIYDSDWNPQCDLQAQDRCHRIGQTKPVVVYRLVTANTIDHTIVQRAAAKRKLEKIVIHQGKFKGENSMEKDLKSSLSSEELLRLLKSVKHDDIVSSGSGGREVLSDSDLEKLLDRSDMRGDGVKAAAEAGGQQTSSAFEVVDKKPAGPGSGELLRLV